jgi:hypothetical protein
MPSSFSTDLKLELMVTGENAGTWGTKTNTNLNLLQQAIAGFQSISIAGGAQTTALTMDNAAISNARNAVIKLTGTITGNQIVTVPNGIEKTYIIENNTTGVFTVEFKTASGTGTTWSTTDKGIKILFTDGTNMLNTIHQRGWMIKVPTKSIMMTPQPGVEINLVELNKQLKGISNNQAASGTRATDIGQNSPSNPPSNTPGVITDESLAAKYRAQANTFEIEVRRLREEAEKLDPKGVVAVVQEKQASQTATETKRGRGRPTKVKMVA